MDTKYQRPKGREGALTSLNVAIEGLNLAKEISGIPPAKAAFGTSDNGQGMSPPVLRRWTPGSHVFRIR